MHAGVGCKSFVPPKETKTSNLHLETELSALMRADKELESAQDYTRGDTKLKPIRDSILARIRELETALAEPSNS